ncbi:DUF2953 domain-containing protein [Bacillus sp. 1NLA3E]|uniref:DUF2953 domain-containing protein n=1 Tax=Bacillus sp. 1NLA3E TaxID=666686 RepID=UPI000247E796|nr:DUF2953 domain-containing protein [Bacillus sp. 1NLA3E]
MKWLAVALIILFLLTTLIIFSKITILLNYHHNKDDDHLTIKFKVWFGLISYKISVPVIKVDDDSPAIVYKTKVNSGKQEGSKKEMTEEKFSVHDLIESLHDMKEFLRHVIALHKIIRYFLRKISIRRLEWHSVIGIGDAALTGTLTGALWSVKGGLIGLISHYMKLKEMPQMSITPNFQRASSQTLLRCMIQFRIGNAMLAGIRLVKFWKGGRPKFQSKQLSKLSKDKSKTM